MAARKKARKKARSLHIGVNDVDHEGAWRDWDIPRLRACHSDANDMARLATSRGMKPRTLLSPQATREAVLDDLGNAATSLRRGDYFLLTYSGHGAQVRDVSGDEADRKDETWCLYDGQLTDDELYLAFTRFAAGVRILVLSDSCHSGTVTRAVAQGAVESAAMGERLAAIARGFRPAVLLISGCQDRQLSDDGRRNGAFTARLKKVWDGGAFTGDHVRFHAAIKEGMPRHQTPNLFAQGDVGAFVRQVPFTV